MSPHQTEGAGQHGHGPRAMLAVSLLFLLSGMSSLILETVWVRMMILVFGSTTFAVSTVLTAFMGGLALGSRLAGKRADNIREPRRALAIYALLELGIGLYAVFLPLIFPRLHQLHTLMWGSGHSSYITFALLRFLLAAALLIIPTVAMGATLPVLARFACAGRPREATGERVGLLYAVNTGGAVLGVLTAGFVLLPTIGMWATSLTACIADLALAAAAFSMMRLLRSGGRRGGRTRGPALTAPAATEPTGGGAGLRRVALVSIAVSGALAMVYQVSWTRALSLIIGSSTYAFSLILTCFLIGLSSGAALYSRRQARQPDQVGNLAVIHMLVAVSSLAGILFVDHLPVLLLTLIKRVDLAPGVIFLIKFLVVGLVMLLPTFFMGMVFPAVINICSGARQGASRTTGDVYAMNTLGAIVGSFCGGFLLIPLVGLQQTLVMMVLAGLALAAMFALLTRRRRTRNLLLVTTAGLVVLVPAVSRPWNREVMTAGVFRVSRYEQVLQTLSSARAAQTADGGAGAPGRAWLEAAVRMIPPSRVVDTMLEPSAGYGIISHREGVTTTVSMTRSVDQTISDRACWVRHALLVNGKPDASLSVLHPRPERGGCAALLRAALPGPGLRISPSGDAETQILSGLLPVTLHAGTPRRALIIGWGSGITAGAVLQSGVSDVVAVELEEAVVEAARFFEPHNHTPQRSARLTLVNEDGRNYLASSTRTYDVIISEPSNPWIAGCGNLFTREFFELVHRRLSREGVFLQWLQSYEIAPENVWSMLGTLSDAFPSVHVFRPVHASSDMLILARRETTPPSWTAIQRHMSRPGIRRELSRIGIREPADLVVRLMAGPRGIRAVTRRAIRNTDDNAHIEFATPKDLINYQRYSPRAIGQRLFRTLGDPLDAITDAPPDAAARLCIATLRAGRPDHALRSFGGRADVGVARCLELARLLTKGIPPLDRRAIGRLLRDAALRPHAEQLAGLEPRKAMKILDTLFVPGVITFPGMALRGHITALGGETFEALALLAAAEEMANKGAGEYAPLTDILTLQYFKAGLFDLAVERIRARQPSKGTSRPPSGAP